MKYAGIVCFSFAVIWLLLVDGEPQFDKKTVNVTAIQGQDAVLPCAVLYKENYQVGTVLFERALCVCNLR